MPWPRLAVITAVVVGVVGVVAAIAIPRIDESKDETARAERREAERARAAKVRLLRAEARVHRDRSTALAGRDSRSLATRRALVAEAERAITRDARGRAERGELDGPVLRTDCVIEPPSRRPLERDPAVRSMAYSCLAVTSDNSEFANEARFAVGHAFRATVDYARLAYEWRKTCLPPGEGSARLRC